MSTVLTSHVDACVTVPLFVLTKVFVCVSITGMTFLIRFVTHTLFCKNAFNLVNCNNFDRYVIVSLYDRLGVYYVVLHETPALHPCEVKTLQW